MIKTVRETSKGIGLQGSRREGGTEVPLLPLRQGLQKGKELFL